MDSANRFLGLGLPRKMTSESRKFRLSKKKNSFFLLKKAILQIFMVLQKNVLFTNEVFFVLILLQGSKIGISTRSRHGLDFTDYHFSTLRNSKIISSPESYGDTMKGNQVVIIIQTSHELKRHLSRVKIAILPGFHTLLNHKIGVYRLRGRSEF